MNNPIKILNSREILERLGYDFEAFSEDSILPETSSLKFSEIIPEFNMAEGKAKEIAEMNLYKHQEMTYNALKKGDNVILISGTGSGKTEAWALYVLKSKIKTLTLYPTLALSTDQISRLESYYNTLGLKDEIIEVDRAVLNKLVAELDAKTVKLRISKSFMVITNPAFLMQDLKRIASKPSKSYLLDFLRNIDVIVVDELDFYGSKGASLIIGMLELIIKHISKKKPQIVILTATLGNPEELAKYVTEINDRPTSIIEGKPFKVQNHIYLVLGKNLKKIWKYILERKREIEEKDPGLLQFIEDYDVFRRYAFKVIEALRPLGIYVPLPAPDVTEILVNYVNSEENGVTLVFTKSIRSAEKLAKTVRSKLPLIKQDLVRTHHHLISKEERKEIEKLAREGLIRIVISPRTLTQGIDIGTVIRVVHYGLPVNVREFKQREGRKGRRINIHFTESLIVPITAWDRRLVEAGYESFKEWVNLPLEKIYFNPNNKYVLMFKGLFKVRLHMKLDSRELELLRQLKLIKFERKLFGEEPVITDEGLRVWRNLGFYEFGPPYGVKRIIIDEFGYQKGLEEISRRDFIEKLQPGCFDPTSESIVVSVKESRVIIEKSIPLAVEENKCINEAYEAYKYTKSIRWSEKPDLKNDYMIGKLYSQVSLYVNVPTRGFGKLVEIPESVSWIVESRSPRTFRTKRGYKLVYDTETLELNVKTYGKYFDYTYGYLYELDPDEDTDKLRVGLAFLMVSLRLSKYRIPLSSLAYYLSPLEHPVKTMIIWEREPSGVLETLKWLDIREFIKNYEPSELTEVLMWAIDYVAVQNMALKDMGWEEVKYYALKSLDYIEGKVKLKLKMVGEIKISKPSKELKMVTIDLLPLKIENNKIIAVAVFNGEDIYSCLLDLVKKNYEANRLAEILSEHLEKGFLLLHYGKAKELDKLKKHAVLLKLVLSEFERKGKINDVNLLLKNKLGLDIAPLEEVERSLGLDVKRKIRLDKIRDLVVKTSKSKFARDMLLKSLRSYVESNAKSTYMLYLIAKEIKQ